MQNGFAIAVCFGQADECLRIARAVARCREKSGTADGLETFLNPCLILSILRTVFVNSCFD
jgi:hypothetical protein